MLFISFKKIDSQADKMCVPSKEPCKRLTCKCPEGYHGDDCSRPIRSCRAYLGVGPYTSDMHKVVDYNNSVYEVYCHFDRLATMTLVQSYSFAIKQFCRHPISKPTIKRYTCQ